jgi:phosphate transport system protein
MSRETLDNKTRYLLDQILVLDSMVENSTLDAVEALKRHDIESARRIYAYDSQINAKRFEIEQDTMITIATQQPIMAHDLRLMASILEVVSELERMGDYAKGIARVTMMIGSEPHIKPLVDIPRMAAKAVDMLHRAIGAFVTGDAETARVIPDEDDEIDDLYNQVYRELVAIMFTKPAAIDQANYLMWAAHNLERLGDRVSNICERTIYVVTGQLKELAASDDQMDKS